MARMQDTEYTFLNDREIAATGLGVSPSSVQAYADLQRAVYELSPADVGDAQAAADGAQVSADTADSKAESAGARADAAQADADTAQGRADDAYTLAGTKVAKNNGPVFTAPAATPSRAALPAYAGGTAAGVYTATDMQAVMDQVAALTSRVAALIVDLRANQALRN